ncbi:hypothetical protein Q4543_08740 [Salipiger sp. 1_MG-2023]|uniref:hypothetical protein n=1 Tax=Salipiger sp. 1_MG-2023 TaxID=3062665 RepID=UPI0026E142F8|nr:hypothetical protein [Salipiger sp. 1_MG-2023]MDO6585605.1 hypothetical protein [Salipiger sp. 1_MG-2023]
MVVFALVQVARVCDVALARRCLFGGGFGRADPDNAALPMHMAVRASQFQALIAEASDGRNTAVLATCAHSDATVTGLAADAPLSKRTGAAMMREKSALAVARGASQRHTQIEAQNADLAQSGYRALGVARRDASWRFFGLLIDPPRPDVGSTLAEAPRMGRGQDYRRSRGHCPANMERSPGGTRTGFLKAIVPGNCACSSLPTRRKCRYAAGGLQAYRGASVLGDVASALGLLFCGLADKSCDRHSGAPPWSAF